MSVVVGVVENGSVYMGADSIAASESKKISTTEPSGKIFRKKDLIIGVAGSIKVMQVMRYVWSPPAYQKNMECMEYLVKVLAKSLRECLLEHTFRDGSGTESDPNPDASLSGTEILIGHRGRLFIIESSYQVLESELSYDAVGAGGDYALGSLFSTVGMPTKKRIIKALEAAETFSPMVKGPYRLLEM